MDHREKPKVEGSGDHTKNIMGSPTDVHPLGIKTKRTSDNAFGVRECVEKGESSPGMADIRSTRNPIRGEAYAMDHLNVRCITSPDTDKS